MKAKTRRRDFITKEVVDHFEGARAITKKH
jgi:hypothetical protein